MSYERCYVFYTGKESSQDERGAAAIIMTQLDQYLNNEPTQFMEYQDIESITFLSYFKAGIQYMVNYLKIFLQKKKNFFISNTCLY